MPKKLEKPLGASSFWKSLFAGLAMSALFTFMIWLFNNARYHCVSGTYGRPLAVREILLGSVWILLGLWSYWAWKPRRRHALWHRWLQAYTGVFYVSMLMLLLAVSSWNVILKYPWNYIANGVLVTLFVACWALPAFSYPLAKRLADWQWALNMRLYLLGVGGLMVTAGIVGANVGRRAVRSGELTDAMLVIALLSSPVALSIAQMGAESMWRYRPWAKEGEE